MSRFIPIILILAISFSEAYCQRIFVSQGEARVKLEDHLSREETRELAREQAIHLAIENVFGSHVSKDAFVNVEEGNTSVTIRGDSQVKGEWLKTTSETFREETRKVNNEKGKGSTTEIWIVCEIEGKIREIVDPIIDFNFSPSNCIDLNCITSDFENGDSFYLHFQTPVDGYLSVYLANEDEAFRILPYAEMPHKYLHNIPVIADQPYLFFSPSKARDYFEDFPYFYTDEIVLDTELDQEFYRLYIIFSPKPFTKPILDNEVVLEGEYTQPKSLSRRHLEVWIQDNRIFDTEFYYKKMNLRVRK